MYVAMVDYSFIQDGECETDYDFSLEETGAEGSSRSADLSGFENLAQDEKLMKIKEHSQKLIDEVEETNQLAKTAPAFVSILTTIGFLSKLAFSKNKDFLKQLSAGKNNPEDSLEFKAFVNKYILCKSDFGFKEKGLAFHLYQVRCGLVHAASLGQFTNSLKIQTYITQEDGDGPTLSEIDDFLLNNPQKLSGKVVYRSSVLCEAMRQGVERLFHSPDIVLANAIIDAYLAESPIEFVKQTRALSSF